MRLPMPKNTAKGRPERDTPGSSALPMVGGRGSNTDSRSPEVLALGLRDRNPGQVAPAAPCWSWFLTWREL